MKQALIVIDVQDSFRQRPFWDESEYPAFVSQLQGLIDAARARDIPVLQVFHTSAANDPANPFSLASGHVKTLKELRIEPDAVFHKTVHSSSTPRTPTAPRCRTGCASTASRASSSAASAPNSAARPPPAMPATTASRWCSRPTPR